MKKIILYSFLVLLFTSACTKPQVELSYNDQEDVVLVAVENLEDKRINTMVEIEVTTTDGRKVNDVQKVTIGPLNTKGILFDFAQEKYHLLDEGEHIKSYEVRQLPPWAVVFKR